MTRRGRPVAVLISIEEYDRLCSEAPSFWSAYAAFRAGLEAAHVEFEPEMFDGVRDPGSGREMSL